MVSAKGGWNILQKSYKGVGRMLGGAGAHTKGLLLLGGTGYTGYHYVANGQGALETWGNLFLGDKAVNKVKEEGVGKVAGDFVLGEGNTEKVVDKGKDLVSSVGDAVGGVGHSLGGGQQGGSLFGSFGNLISGLFSGGTGSIVGLIAAGMALFGNFGWMGKIVCGLIAAMSFGLFGGNSQQVASQQQVRAAVEGRGESSHIDYSPQADAASEESSHVVHRSR